MTNNSLSKNCTIDKTNIELGKNGWLGEIFSGPGFRESWGQMIDGRRELNIRYWDNRIWGSWLGEKWFLGSSTAKVRLRYGSSTAEVWIQGPELGGAGRGQNLFGALSILEVCLMCAHIFTKPIIQDLNRKGLWMCEKQIFILCWDQGIPFLLFSSQVWTVPIDRGLCTLIFNNHEQRL